MKTIKESFEMILNSQTDQEIPAESRKEMIDDLMVSVHLQKNVIAPVYARFFKLLSTSNEFSDNVGKIYSEMFSGVDPSVKDAFLNIVGPVRIRYIDNPDKENRKILVRKLYAVLALASDDDVRTIVYAERQLWSVLVEYWNR